MERRRSPHASTVQIPVRGSDRERLRSTSRSSSEILNEQPHSYQPMAIPGVRYDEPPPPPLPPPRYNEELDRGVDTAWKWGNRSSFGTKSKLAPVKPESSLYGGYLGSKDGSIHAAESRDMDEDEQDDHHYQQLQHDDSHFQRRGSTVSTIRSLSQADIKVGDHIPSLIRRPSSPLLGNQRLQGERPLAQESLNRSSHAYDQQLLSKIGKPSSPPRNSRTISLDGGLLTRKLSLQTEEASAQRSLVNDLSSTSTGDHLSRWVSSPSSTAGLSPGSRFAWREHHHPQHHHQDHRSPSVDSTANSLILDPELFVHARSGGRHPFHSGQEDSLGVSTRRRKNHYDQTIFADSEMDFSGDDNGGFRNLHLDDGHLRKEKRSPKQGTKRRAISPPSGLGRDDKPLAQSTELYHSLATTTNAGRSPITRYQPKYGSISSTSSSVRHNSYASSVALSATGSSMTSISSFERNSPSDPSYSLPQSTSVQSTLSPVTSNPSSKKHQAQQSNENRSPAHKISVSSAMPEHQTPPVHRVGPHYICDCCPKKPRKFDTEDDLRTHQMEKQYSCQYCNNRFKNKNEAERHQNSLHLRRHSWSCAAIPNYQAVFHPSGSPTTQGSTTSTHDTCGYCGEEFPNLPQPDWDRRIDHLTNKHKFGECNQSKKFFRADHFRQHLKHSHAGQSGKWTNSLETVCLREETPSETSGLSPTSSETSQTRGPSSLPAPSDVPMGGATIDEDQEES